MVLKIAVVKERDELERRVPLVPEHVRKAVDMGFEVLVEKGAGDHAFFSDSEYAENGASVSEDRHSIIGDANIMLLFHRPDEETISMMKEGTVLIGSMAPELFPEILSRLAKSMITTFSLELIPRLTRAQSMDVLSSQASVAGYRAAILGALNSPRIMPMLTTAAGTIRPMSVFIVGAGVAGLMAVSTSKRLGASVSAFDVRKTAGEDVRSLGARFIETSFDAVGSGGYARDLTDDEKAEQNDLLTKAVASADVVITAASVPGKKAPRIITRKMVEGMKSGAVIVDIASEFGGNCDLTEPGGTVEFAGVRILGPTNLPSEVPRTSSMMYSRNMLSFLELLLDGEGNLQKDFTDEILVESLVTHRGDVRFKTMDRSTEGEK